jgi:hypothetical protein
MPLTEAAAESVATPGPAQDLWIAAAVREHFRPANLLQAWTEHHAGDPSGTPEILLEAILDLQETCVRTQAPGGETSFTLPESDRLKVLSEAGLDRVRRELEWIPPGERTEAQQVLLDIVAGAPVEPDLQDRQKLAALAAVAARAEAVGADLPLPRATIQQRIAQLDYLELLGGPDLRRFVGRAKPIKALKRLWGQRGGPVLISAIGGMGKSLLVSRFIADLLGDEGLEPPSAIVHLDFDRSALQRANAATVMAEVVRQVAARWRTSSNMETLAALAQEVAGLGASFEGVGSLAVSSEAHRDLSYYAAQLVEALGRPCRILMFVDSFEQAQLFSDEAAESPEAVRRLLVEEGAEVLDIYASRHFGEAWVAGLRRKPYSLPLEQLTPEEAIHYLRRELAGCGIAASPIAIDQVAEAVGRTPLALRLAVALIQKGGGSWDPEEWATRLRHSPERIQAALYDRILLRIADEDVSAMAYPGLLVRRLTPALVAEVLAGPCGLPRNERFARELLTKAEREGQLFVKDPNDPEALRHRQDVRTLMLPDLDFKIPSEVARKINEGAIRYYARFEDVNSRTEELYHRLRLDQPPSQVNPRWSEAAGTRLQAVAEELPERARLYLRRRTHAGASVEFRPESSGWHRGQPPPTALSATVQEVRNYIRHRLRSGGNPAPVRELLEQERLSDLDGPAGDLVAEVMMAEGRSTELIDQVRGLVPARPDAVYANVRASVLVTAGAAAEGHGRLDAAASCWKAALRTADQAGAALGLEGEELFIVGLRAAVGQSRVDRKHGRSAPDPGLAERFRSGLPRIAGELRRQPALAREMTAELLPFLAMSSSFDWLRRPIILVFDMKEAFASALENPKRCEELGLRLFNRPLTNAYQLHDMASKWLYNTHSSPSFAMLVEVVREEVDWTLKRALLGWRESKSR